MYKEKQFIFTSAWKIAKFYEQTLKNIGREKDLTQSEMDVLIFLLVNEPINTSKDVAEHRSISKSLICKSVSNLVKKGLLISEVDKIDGRVMRLTLTQEGKVLAEELNKKCEELCSNLFTGISESEISFIDSIFTRILGNGKK